MKVRHLISLGMLLLSSLAAADEPVAWEALSEEQKQVLGQFESNWDELPAERRQRLMIGADRYASMNDEQRAAARQRLRSRGELRPQASFRSRFAARKKRGTPRRVR